MAEKKKKNYNIMSLDGITDQEYVDMFGVPLELANTPQINKWLIDDTYSQNLDLEYKHALKQGRSETEAKAWAKKVADKGKRDAQENVKNITKSRGY
jgi:hypothetical protein